MFVSSFHLSQQDILDAIEEPDGEKWTVKRVKSEEFIARGKKATEEGDFAGINNITTGGAMGKQG